MIISWLRLCLLLLWTRLLLLVPGLLLLLFIPWFTTHFLLLLTLLLRSGTLLTWLRPVSRLRTHLLL